MSSSQANPNLDLPSVIVGVVKQMTKVSAEKAGEHLATSFAEYFVSAAIATGTASIIGVGFGALIEALLKGADRNAQLLNALASEPFATGTREVLHLLSLQKSAEFLENNLKLSIQKLHSALTLAENANDEDQQIFILFLIGISEARLRGGLESSAIRLDAMRKILAARIQKINNEISSLGPFSQDEYRIRTKGELRQAKVNATAYKYRWIIPIAAYAFVFGIKAGVKGTELVEIAVATAMAKTKIKKREALYDRRTQLATLSEVVSKTIEKIG